MKKTRPLVIGILLFSCAFSVFVSSATNEDNTMSIVYVGGSGPGNYTRIQDALENISVHGAVYVFPGTYHEVLRITKPVFLIGDDANNTIIDGDNKDYVVTLAAGNCTLSGFTITQSKMIFPFAGIYIISDHNTISQNILTDNFYGMQLGYSASYTLIINNTIHHNRRCGIYFNHASFNTLVGNVVFDQPVNGFGLFEFSNNNTIFNNTFSDNRNTGVNIRESYNTHVTNNTFVQGQIAFHKPPPEYHTVGHDNQFSDNVVSTEEERDAFVFTVLVFDFFVFIVFLVFRKIVR
jgi:parallel beta-helix repeat protein